MSLIVQMRPGCPQFGSFSRFVNWWMVEHVDVHKATILQGRFGGTSPKPTSLLIACGQGIDLVKHFSEHETTSCLPCALRMGWNSDKREFETAGLKNYPPALCECRLASLADKWLKIHFRSVDGLSMVPMQEFIRYTDELVQTFNTVVLRGADFHRPVTTLHS